MRSQDLHRQLYYGVRQYRDAFLAIALVTFNAGLALGVAMTVLVRG